MGKDVGDKCWRLLIKELIPLTLVAVLDLFGGGGIMMGGGLVSVLGVVDLAEDLLCGVSGEIARSTSFFIFKFAVCSNQN